MTPLSSDAALAEYFLEVRCRLLDAAAILDRIDRGGAPPGDDRVERIRRAIAALGESGPGRAERIQEIFSLTYDPNWERPEPRSA